MICAWTEFLSILPIRIRDNVDKLGRESLQELRLRINAPPELVLGNSSQWLTGSSTREELNFVINAASQYSPWAASTIACGYITAPGGHRIGICGEAIVKKDALEGIRKIYSLCIRIARDFPGIGATASQDPGSILILGAPGWGKTTLLRDMIRNCAEREHVSVIDERGELFPRGFRQGRLADVMTGCPKTSGIEVLLRTMNPTSLAVDEITAEKDCNALLHAANCGVRLMATAHASSLQDFYSRTIYKPLVLNNVFSTFYVLNRNKTYTVERMSV